ncbi:SMC-Scp complex subunit ScpB [Caproicibacterium sp. XB2]|jgi:segregation and condensation protein B|uniref:SMC-Scp complex subunit ScpB n=1 Tax=Caproicibacterium TaxID=2834348 RepID=UPI003850A6A2
MKCKDMTGALQAMLFANGEPLPLERIAEVLGLTPQKALQLAEETRMAFNTANRGIQIIRVEDSYQMCSAPPFAGQVRALLNIRHNAPLSQAALEALAIIAYNQPVTKAFVEQIRGVDSSSTVNSLCQKGLAEECGRLELPGRPLLYRTTSNFLRCMGIASLDELPPLKQDEKSETEATPDSVSQVSEAVP